MEGFLHLLESLGIEWQVALAQAMALLVLLVVVAKFLFEPFAGIMRQRQEQIANELANAEAQQVRAESLRKEYEAHLTAIADEARAKMDQAMKDAETARQRVLDAAQAEIRELHERNQAQLTLEHEQLRRALRAEMADVAITAATKALRNQLTPAIQQAVNDQVIHDLEQLPRA